MYYNYNKKLKPISQKLRKEMTPEEKHLWYDFLKLLPITVHRQKTIGNYIADFYISNRNIVIELDGSQHGRTENREADIQRDNDFRMLGITVLRYRNEHIHNNYEQVCRDILRHLELDEISMFR